MWLFSSKVFLGSQLTQQQNKLPKGIDASSLTAIVAGASSGIGAATTCYAALRPDIKGMTGKYYADSDLAETSSHAKDKDLAKSLWDFTLNFTEHYKPQLEI